MCIHTMCIYIYIYIYVHIRYSYIYMDLGIPPLKLNESAWVEALNFQILSSRIGSTRAQITLNHIKITKLCC